MRTRLWTRLESSPRILPWARWEEVSMDMMLLLTRLGSHSSLTLRSDIWEKLTARKLQPQPQTWLLWISALHCHWNEVWLGGEWRVQYIHIQSHSDTSLLSTWDCLLSRWWEPLAHTFSLSQFLEGWTIIKFCSQQQQISHFRPPARLVLMSNYFSCPTQLRGALCEGRLKRECPDVGSGLYIKFPVTIIRNNLWPLRPL